eukprot:CAMPEP_0117657134 /NCGR_PEP_ID=MMETSP0804-20121206/5172_1 /TAXON_ID=1074897 /ORGANISM="Tetraselmis astigmatica, Strain CCMP880" /LENGTH=113 /DNA_ID=CAMNT_0005463575 /DNA_START=108 /DNA_END=449 /DNA_ORIENTATION=+
MSQPVHVRLVVEGNAGGTASLKLYVYDKLLMDAAAAEVASQKVTVIEGERVVVALRPDPRVEQAGKTYEEMYSPSMYISLDCSSSTLTYATGPVFDVKPGDTVDLALKAKDST